MEENTYELRLKEELEARIQEIESADYEFPKKFSKKDYLLVVAVVVFCLGAIIWGAFL